MNHLTAFLTRLQTFELRLVDFPLPQKEYSDEKVVTRAYDITHETPYYDSFSFRSSIRVMKDMALIDLNNLNQLQLERQLAELQKLVSRFNRFWVNYHHHYSGYYQEYKSSYPFSIDLDDLFIVHNLQADYSDVLVNEKFVEDLSDSVKLRENYLDELIKDVVAMIAKYGKADQTPLSPSNSRQDGVTTTVIDRYPTFKDRIAADVYNILKSYFSSEDQEALLSLLEKNVTPTENLVYKDNGNQLADAFKQLFEANLIVGCSKADLEEWITRNFQYVYNNQAKSFTSGYLNGIISSNAKKCQSPILDVKRQQDGNYIVVPTIRTNKSTKN